MKLFEELVSLCRECVEVRIEAGKVTEKIDIARSEFRDCVLFFDRLPDTIMGLMFEKENELEEIESTFEMKKLKLDESVTKINQEEAKLYNLIEKERVIKKNISRIIYSLTNKARVGEQA